MTQFLIVAAIIAALWLPLGFGVAWIVGKAGKLGETDMERKSDAC